MRNLLSGIFLAMVLFSPVYAKAESFKVTVDKAPADLQIVQVDSDQFSTLVSFIMVCPDNPGDKLSSFWMHYSSFDEGTVLRTKDGREYQLISSINMPIKSEAEYRHMSFDRPGQEHHFLLEFERIPDNTEYFDIIEDEIKENAYNIYGVHLLKEAPVEAVDVEAFIHDYPVKEYGYYYDKGNVICYYTYKGIIIQVKPSVYPHTFMGTVVNHFFRPCIDLQNLTGKSIKFSTDNVSIYTLAILPEKSAKKRYKTRVYLEMGGSQSDLGFEELHVMPETEFRSMISTTQDWENVFASSSIYGGANNAGYSTSTTKVYGTVNTNTNYSALGYASTFGSDGSNYNTYGFATGSSSTFSRYYGTSVTTTYNAAEAYMTRSQANKEWSEYLTKQYLIKESLLQDYLKTNTIKNEQDYAGYLYSEYVDDSVIVMRITLKGVNYDFVF